MNGIININDLPKVAPVISKQSFGFYKERCLVCLHNQGHSSGVRIKVVEGKNTHSFGLQWDGEVTNKSLLQNADLVKSTDHAAVAIALLLVPKISPYKGVEEAVRGTSVDYYLSSKEDDDDTFNIQQSCSFGSFWDIMPKSE